MWEITVHSPEFNLTVKTSLCTKETKLSDAKSASRKQGERAHKPAAACGTRGMSGGGSVRGRQRVMPQQGTRGREQRMQDRG